ncbi:ABC transporter ATP-binding protein [Micrococcus luteus]|uniref:ABC transporter ATP-binding protein n=1 Tax=Micrococcus luteus TaxID=1270 RepID=UPI002106354B|nr:ABC transporter ATP-binding protein [Micrococcus luteus]UTX34846.1 ABC transporter ATP-binding protein [Micrococcus luteus]
MRVDVHDLVARRGDRAVVHGVSLSVPGGAVLGLLGPNGSGKSSLLRAIAGIDRPAAGEVLLDGVPTAGMGRRDVARRVAVMAQEHGEEFEMTVLELVLLGRIPHGRGFARDSAEDHAHARDALERVGAGHLAHRPFSALSGGERQRVLFARALAQDTPVLILDEPTNHLDIAHQLELLRLVRGAGRTVLVALHDLNLAAEACDSLAVLVHGELVAHGRPDDVLDAELARRAFGVAATAVTHPGTGRRHLLFDGVAPGPAEA